MCYNIFVVFSVNQSVDHLIETHLLYVANESEAHWVHRVYRLQFLQTAVLKHSAKRPKSQARSYFLTPLNSRCPPLLSRTKPLTGADKKKTRRMITTMMVKATGWAWVVGLQAGIELQLTRSTDPANVVADVDVVVTVNRIKWPLAVPSPDIAMGSSMQPPTTGDGQKPNNNSYSNVRTRFDRFIMYIFRLYTKNVAANIENLTDLN